MALESLAPDQRAVLELILRRDRSYSDLAGLLGISEGAVRDRAHAGVAALAPADGVTPGDAGRITDYLLGQAGEAQSETSALMLRSPAARDWALSVAAVLAPVAGHELPPIPPARTASEVPEPEADEERTAVSTAIPAAGTTGGKRRRGRLKPSGARTAAASSPSGASRRGGALLIGFCTIALAVLAAWALNRGDDGSSDASDSASAAASATPAPTPQTLTEIALRGVGGSKANGLLQVNASAEGRVGIVVVAQEVKPSATDEAYAVWLTDARRKPFRIGFEGKDSGAAGAADGTLALSGPSPDIDGSRFTRALTQYDRLVISLEKSDTGAAPASVVLQGSLKRLQGDS